MYIGRPTQADVETLTTLWVSLARGQRTYGSHVLDAENEPAVRSMLAHAVAADRIYVAADPDPVGFVTYALESGVYAQDARRGFVENLFVVPSRRGAGVGSRLLRAAECDLQAAGAETIALDVLAENDEAKRFYARRGYSAHRIELEKRVESDTKGNE